MIAGFGFRSIQSDIKPSQQFATMFYKGNPKK